jgi:ribonuclease Z
MKGICFFGTSGAIPSTESGNVSFVLRGKGSSYLVDASGNPVQSLMKAGVDPLELDAVILTHTHTDHLYALPSLFHTLWMMHRTKELQIFTNPNTKAKSLELLSIFRLKERTGLFPYRFITEPDHLLKNGETIELFSACHSVPTCGFWIAEGDARVLYTSDTSPLIPGILDRYIGRVDVLIHEASGLSSQEDSLNQAGHSSARQAGETARMLKANTLFLCHLPAEKKIQVALLEEAKGVFSEGVTQLPVPFHFYRFR